MPVIDDDQLASLTEAQSTMYLYAGFLAGMEGRLRSMGSTPTANAADDVRDFLAGSSIPEIRALYKLGE